MPKTPSAVIRLPVTSEVRMALSVAKRKYPALSDPEILKLGLSKIAIESDSPEAERNEIRRSAAYSMGLEYLQDAEEDGYSADMGKKVDFS